MAEEEGSGETGSKGVRVIAYQAFSSDFIPDGADLGRGRPQVTLDIVILLHTCDTSVYEQLKWF